MTLYFRSEDMKLEDFDDVDLGEDVNNKNSTIGYVYTLRGTTVS